MQGELCWSLFWRTSHCYGVVCSYPGCLLASLAFVSGCSFDSVGIQASVLSVDPLFCSAALVFLALLPVVFRSNFFWMNLFFPKIPLFPSNRPLLLPLFFQFSLFSSVVGSLLSSWSKQHPLNQKCLINKLCFFTRLLAALFFIHFCSDGCQKINAWGWASVYVDIMATSIFRRAPRHAGISTSMPWDASTSFDLVEMDRPCNPCRGCWFFLAIATWACSFLKAATFPASSARLMFLYACS